MMAGDRDDPAILDISMSIKGSSQVYGHTHCPVGWFPLIEACLDV